MSMQSNVSKNKIRWYNLISGIYELLGDHYIHWRKKAINTLSLKPDQTVIDLCCGSGRNLEHILDRIGENGKVIAIDSSSAMLKRAQQRYAKDKRINWVCMDVQDLDISVLRKIIPEVLQVDRILCTFGLTVVLQWEEVFYNTFSMLNKDGRYTIMDLHWGKCTPICQTISTFAAADSTRRVWEPLKSLSDNYQEISGRFLDGSIIIASGSKRVQ